MTPHRRQLLIGLLVLLATVAPIAWQWHRQVRAPLAHPDEAAWIFYTYYYHLLFDQFDPWHRDWQDELAFHHPPLGRYIFGAALASRGLQERSLEDFRWWQQHDLDYADMYWQPYWTQMRERAKPDALATTRTVSALFALLACAAMAMLARELAPRLQIAAVLFLAWNPLLLATAAVGLAETMLLFFLLLHAWAAVRLGRTLTEESATRARMALDTALWGASAALPFGVKIVGLSGWLLSVLVLRFALVGSPPKLRARGVMALLGGSALALALTLMLNPTLWPHPLGHFGRYFSFRAEQMAMQREAGFWNAFTAWPDRFAHFVRHIFLDQDFFFARFRFPLGLLLFLAGIFRLAETLPSQWRQRPLAASPWIVAGMAGMGATAFTSFFMPWPRYLLPAMPWVLLAEALGLECVLQSLPRFRDELREHRRKWMTIGLAALVITAFCLSPLFPPPTPYSSSEKDFFLLENSVKRHPHNKILRVELAVAFQALGRTAEADAEWAKIAAPDADEEFSLPSKDIEQFFQTALAQFPNDQRLVEQAARYRARAAPPIEVGFAAREITPDLKEGKAVWMAGYGSGRRATSVHDPLMARATVLRNGGQKIALVSLDLVGFFEADCRKVREALKDYAAVVVASTHVHEGPDTMGLWGGTPFTSGVDADYLSQVRAAAILAVRDAEKNLKPADASLGTVDASELMNDSRQPYVKMGKLTVLRFDAPQKKADSKPLGLVVFWHNHPEFLGSGNHALSADFVGALLKKLSAKHGCPANYFNGAVGGLMTPHHKDYKDADGKPLPPESFAALDQYADEVVARADAALAATQPILLSPFTFHSSDVFLPLQNRLYVAGYLGGILQRDVFDENGKPLDKDAVSARAIESKDVFTHTTVGLWQMGELRIFLAPGEIYPELVIGGIQTPQDPAADFQGAPVEPPIFDPASKNPQLIIGLANDEIGYIIPKSQWDERAPFAYNRKSAQYGEVNSCGPDVAPRISAALRELKDRAK